MKKLYTTTTAWAVMVMLLMMCAADVCAQEKTPAFPGAEGFGRYVTGGRGGYVYTVTTLDDGSDEGTLRWALSQSGPRTIVFAVSGTIHLTDELSIPSNTTIAGQSAPGDGICVADYPVTMSGNNIIVRYMRFRLGNNYVTIDGADGWDGFGGMDQADWMIDHCSVSWSIDECLSVLGNENTTVQWCLVAQSLVNSGHSKGAHGYGGNWGGSGASFHHNLIAHHTSRTPRLGPRYTTQLDERMDMRNNVIYNYGSNGCYGGEAMNVNIVNNYYKPGPGSSTGTKGKRIAGIGIRTESYVATYPAYEPTLHIWGKYYVDGNVNPTYSDVTEDNWTYGIYAQIDEDDCDGTYTDETKDTIKLDEPIDFILTTTHSAEDAYEKVLDYVGASLHRDSFDSLMVSDTRNGVATYTGSGLSSGFVNSQDDNKPDDADDTWSAWPTLNQYDEITDSDGDGMDDDWETENGLDPTDPEDRNTYNDDGYTMLEVYLNSLVADITDAQNEGGTEEGSITEDSGDSVEASYTLSPKTYSQTADGQWQFTNGFAIETSKGYASGTSCGLSSIKYSRNVCFKLIIPDGITIDKVEIEGYGNSDTDDAYLKYFGDSLVTFAETDYVLPSRSGGVTATYEIELDREYTDSLLFEWGGAQAGAVITLYTVEGATAIESVQTASTTARNADNKTYNLQGQRVWSTEQRGIYIRDGKKFVVK